MTSLTRTNRSKPRQEVSSSLFRISFHSIFHVLFVLCFFVGSINAVQTKADDGCAKVMQQSVQANQCLSQQEREKLLSDFELSRNASITAKIDEEYQRENSPGIWRSLKKKRDKKHWIVPIVLNGNQGKTPLLRIEGRLQSLALFLNYYTEVSTASLTVLLCLHDLPATSPLYEQTQQPTLDTQQLLSTLRRRSTALNESSSERPSFSKDAITRLTKVIENIGANLTVVDISERMRTFKEQTYYQLHQHRHLQRHRLRKRILHDIPLTLSEFQPTPPTIPFSELTPSERSSYQLESRYMTYFHTIDMFAILSELEQQGQLHTGRNSSGGIDRFDYLLRFDTDIIQPTHATEDIFGYIQARSPVDIGYITLTEEVRPSLLPSMQSFVEDYVKTCKLSVDDHAPLLAASLSPSLSSKSKSLFFFQPISALHVASIPFLRRADVRHFIHTATMRHLYLTNVFDEKEANHVTSHWWTDETVLGLAIRLFSSPDRMLPIPHIRLLHVDQNKVLQSLQEEGVNKVIRTFSRYSIRDEIIEHVETEEERSIPGPGGKRMILSLALNDTEVVDLMRDSLQYCVKYKL